MMYEIELQSWFKTKPIVLFNVPEDLRDELMYSRRGLERFTVVRQHSEFKLVKTPTLCLVEMSNGSNVNCYVGVVTAKQAVATTQSRLSFAKLTSLNLKPLNALRQMIEGGSLQTALNRKLQQGWTTEVLSPALSSAIIAALAKDPDSARAIEAAAYNIPRLRNIPDTEWAQSDAIKTAVEVFGLAWGEDPAFGSVPDQSDSTLQTSTARVLEDSVIFTEGSQIAGFDLIDRTLTGKAVFRRADEKLTVYTANKNPLEEMLGVDLIYVNEILGSIVMVQYKMLERSRNDGQTQWWYRPDRQLLAELSRMKIPPIKGQHDSYRMHDDPFFFKFVRREGDGKTHPSFVLTVEHLRRIMGSQNNCGPRGGVRIDFETLGGAYLRQDDLVGLIRSGYVGTLQSLTKILKPLIEEVSRGNRSLVLAWQERVQRSTAA